MIYRILTAVRMHSTRAILAAALALTLGSLAHFLLTVAAFITLARSAETRRSKIGASLQTARDAAAEIDNAKPMVSLAISADILFGATGVGLGLWGSWRQFKNQQ